MRCRVWWQRHLLALIVGVTVAVALTLSTLVAVYVWSNRHQMLGSYKPVNEAVPEQELQQL